MMILDLLLVIDLLAGGLSLGLTESKIEWVDSDTLLGGDAWLGALLEGEGGVPLRASRMAHGAEEFG